MRHDTTATIGLWLARDVASRWSLSLPIARQIVAHCLGAVERDLEIAAGALGRGSPDLGVVARTLAVRLGYARDRAGGAQGVA